MGQNLLVSVVIPTYNQPQLLLETLESVFAQTFTNYEVVVVNDGSTDDTVERLSPFASRIRVVTQENTGIGAARNRGIEESRGKYVALLDHDDLWVPEKLAIQVEFLERRPHLVAAAATFANSIRPDEIMFDPAAITETDGTVLRPLEKLAAHHNFLQTSALMFRRDRLGTARYGTARGAIEDVPFHVQLLAQGPIGVVGDRPLVIYRMHALNFSRHADYFDKGMALLRQLHRDGLFDAVAKDEQGDLRDYLALLGRYAAYKQLAAGPRWNAAAFYVREFPHQLRQWRFRFLLLYLLMLAMPPAVIHRRWPPDRSW